jgi:hypothetical protein
MHRLDQKSAGSDKIHVGSFISKTRRVLEYRIMKRFLQRNLSTDL